MDFLRQFGLALAVFSDDIFLIAETKMKALLKAPATKAAAGSAESDPQSGTAPTK
jgi:hypothetical protein